MWRSTNLSCDIYINVMIRSDPIKTDREFTLRNNPLKNGTKLRNFPGETKVFPEVRDRASTLFHISYRDFAPFPLHFGWHHCSIVQQIHNGSPTCASSLNRCQSFPVPITAMQSLEAGEPPEIWFLRRPENSLQLHLVLRVFQLAIRNRSQSNHK